MSGKELSTAALRLPPKQRAKLAEELLASLNQDSSEAIDAEWAKEIEARIDAFDSGKMKARPLASVLRSLKRRKKR
jgi:putative addiction module component (TIGR02574 family)